jgi:hypothetical protein
MGKILATLIAVLLLAAGVWATERQYNKHSFQISTTSDTSMSGFTGCGAAAVTVCDAAGCETKFTNAKGMVSFRLPVADTFIEVTVIPIEEGLCSWSATLGLSGVAEEGLINHYVLLSSGC